ncbi:MAG: hypothetical protein CM15mP83_4360 [Flavobacteriaceae bacterium]|nr:MAG: hypothetical protein CM15mP83_4360 [Flavobacteriaceae bacterium]
MRDSDIVSMDMTSVKSNELQGGLTQVNGLQHNNFVHWGVMLVSAIGFDL